MDDVRDRGVSEPSCAHIIPKNAAAASAARGRPSPSPILDEIAGGQRPIHLPDTQEYVEWVHPELRRADLIDLHQGQFSVQAFLDLHGFTVPEAEEELDLFLRESFRKGLTCVKIIHGRGLRSVKGPRIKDAVIRRLLGHFRKDMIAYTSARQCDGGLGALYVLLRKR